MEAANRGMAIWLQLQMVEQHAVQAAQAAQAQMRHSSSCRNSCAGS